MIKKYFTNNELFTGSVIVYAELAVFAKTLSFTVALNVVLISLVVTPAVPVVVIYLPMVFPSPMYLCCRRFDAHSDC